jgi:hypothetical protein
VRVRCLQINAADAILIFDEAHNIEDQARWGRECERSSHSTNKELCGAHKGPESGIQTETYTLPSRSFTMACLPVH